MLTLALAASSSGLACGPSGATGAATGGGVSFDAGRAWADLETQVGFGPRPSGTEANTRTREWIAKRLADLGMEPTRETFTDSTPAGEIPFGNVWADLPATGPEPESSPILYLVSHFDTKRGLDGFVGANDGASSTAVVLELARVLASRSSRTWTYRFLFTDGEEAVRWDWAGNDNTYGSRHHVAELRGRKEERARVKGCVLLDLVGDADLKLEWDTNSHRHMLEAFVEAGKELGFDAHLPEFELRRAMKDDHLPFRFQAGIPAVDLIDFEYGPNNDYWHSLDDTPEHCSRESLRIIGELTLAGLPKVQEVLLPAGKGD